MAPPVKMSTLSYVKQFIFHNKEGFRLLVKAIIRKVIKRNFSLIF